MARRSSLDGRTTIPLIIIASSLCIGCGGDDGVGSDPDVIAPGTIDDLQTVSFTDTLVTVSWTAPGDDGTEGRATSYDLRYSDEPLTAANWESATQADGEPPPRSAGSEETFVVYGLAEGGNYFFGVRTADEIPNWSDVSNSVDSPTAYRWAGNDHLYLAVKMPAGITWTGADSAAPTFGEGWHLVTITSADENAFAFDLVDDDPGFWTAVGSNYEGPWLGAFLVGPGVGDYEWVTGEPFTYTNWGPFEPFGNGDRLGLFGYQTTMGPDWNDVPNERLVGGYIVECSACNGAN